MLSRSSRRGSRGMSRPLPPGFPLSPHGFACKAPLLLPRSRLSRPGPCNEYLGLISFRIEWLDLLAVQGTLKSLLQPHISEASILRCLAFPLVQLSHLYMTTGKPIALTRWMFVAKVMSLLFNMLSRLVIAFLPRSKLGVTIGSII